MKEAMYYVNKEDYILCNLCPHHCHLREGQTGRCSVRKVVNNQLYSLNYGKISTIQSDPIEKKPILGWMQGSRILSVGSFGCNLKCDFCQNHEISMQQPETMSVTPEDIVKEAVKYKLPSIAYTYNEPTIFFEMMLDTAKLAQKKGIKNVMVTNGFICEEPLIEILKYLDAMNIDLKTYSDENYKKLGGSTVDQILRTIELSSKACHVEISLLIVPGLSDSVDQMEAIFQRLKEINSDLILHISRYFPQYQYDEPATSISIMMEIRKRALKYFRQVHLGNVR